MSSRWPRGALLAHSSPHPPPPTRRPTRWLQAKIGCGSNPPSSAENGIAARDDLNPPGGVYPISALGHRDHAGIDAKYTSWSMMTGRPSPLDGRVPPSALSSAAQSGPTYDQQPPFVFSQSDYGNTTSHVGMPDVWMFPWVTMSWV